MTKEVEDWINEVLSKPNKIFGNLPPCPYARKAWKDKKVKVTYDRAVLMEDYAKLKSGELTPTGRLLITFSIIFL